MKRKVICILVLLIVVSGIAFTENKTALVIGNSAYQHFPKLSRPWQEANAMKAALERLGFDVVYVVDGTYDRMYDALYTFERRLRRGVRRISSSWTPAGTTRCPRPPDRRIPAAWQNSAHR